jgi:hypothetical protein
LQIIASTAVFASEPGAAFIGAIISTQHTTHNRAIKYTRYATTMEKIGAWGQCKKNYPRPRAEEVFRWLVKNGIVETRSACMYRNSEAREISTKGRGF